MTQDDPLYVVRFFEAFLDAYPRDEFEICGITIDRAFREPLWKTARRMLRLYGLRDFLRLGLRFARVRLGGRGILELARAHGIPALPTHSVNDPGYLRRVHEMAPDAIVSVAAAEIFRKDLLSAARLGCINVHSGRLPEYRGMMPTFWQLLHGEGQVTVTVHEMVEKLDAGRILETAEVPVRENDSLHRIITETKRVGAGLVIDALRNVAAGTSRPVALDMSRASYFSFPRRADVLQLRRQGHRML